MKNLETKIKINAPIEIVWETLINFEDYPNWNPFVKSISGNPAVHESLETKIALGEKISTFKPKVLKCEKEKEFRWLGSASIKGVFDGEHYFILTSEDEKTTLFTHGENFSGLLSGMIMRKIGAQTKTGFISMNEALKSKAESK